MHDEKYHLGDFHGGECDVAESQHRGDERDDQERYD
jgi:hypothetical protein